MVHISPSRARTYDPDLSGLTAACLSRYIGIEQILPYPLGRLHPFDLSLTLNSIASSRMTGSPNKFPRSVFMGKCRKIFRRIVMLFNSLCQIAGRTYVELTFCVLKNIGPVWSTSEIHISPSRARTYDLAVTATSRFP